jgi:hypothetical protein
MSDVDSKYVALFQEKREIEDEIWKECPDPGVILPKNPKDNLKGASKGYFPINHETLKEENKALYDIVLKRHDTSSSN